MVIDRPLRVALLCYRGEPHCGGQGVYIRHLSRELVALGHQVEVIAGPPYPTLDPGVGLTRLPGLELFAEPNPFRTPALAELRTAADWVEHLDWRWRGNYPEPLAFSLRAWRHLRSRRAEFDLVHDNQGLGYGLLGLRLPVLATVHHPVVIDRDLTVTATSGEEQSGARRWYRFVPMQHRVARRLPRVLTVSGSSRQETVDRMGVHADRVSVVPPGVDHEVFRPDPTVPRRPGRIVTTASADVPLKGLRYLVSALSMLDRSVELVVVGKARPDGPTARLVDELGLAQRVSFHSGLSDDDLAKLLRGAEVACVPSLFEGFSLPAAEAMACGTPLVCTDIGALREVAGDCALLVPPGNADALATGLATLLDDADLRRAFSARGVERAQRFSWRSTAEVTASHYRSLLADDRSSPVVPGAI